MESRSDHVGIDAGCSCQGSNDDAAVDGADGDDVDAVAAIVDEDCECSCR